jgi:hypothetical protein
VSRRPSPLAHRLAAALAVALTPFAGAAQTVLSPPVQRLAFDRPEAWGMKFAAAVLAFTPLAADRPGAAGAVELGLEAGSVPSLSRAERRIGFDGTKVEDIDRTPAVGRLRLRFGLPRDFGAEIGVVPPVELDGIEPRFVAVALSRQIAARGRLRLAGRLVAQHGRLAGDITCSRDDVAAGDNPQGNPFGCEAPSRDELELTEAGGGVVAALAARSDGGLEPYLALTALRLDGEFRVDARYRGVVDRSRLRTEGWTWRATAGVSGALGERWRGAGEVDYAPLAIRRPGQGRANEPVLDIKLALSRRLR